MEPLAVEEILFDYLYDVIYKPDKAFLDVEKLAENFRDFGYGLQFFVSSIAEAREMAHALSKGDLDCKIPKRDNELSAPLKALHASLKHLTWQAQQIAQGDYSQRVSFMGDFAVAFNTMAAQVEERQRLEAEEKAELQHYIDNFLEADKARVEAQAANRAKIEFMERVSHEMLTPMNTILGMVAVGLDTDDEERKKQCFERIDNSAQRLLLVINDILDMSELEADNLELVNRVFMFDNMMGNVISIIDSQTKRKNQHFEIDIDSSIPSRLISDEKRLSRVLINMLSNAVKFTPVTVGEIVLKVELISVEEEYCTIRFIVKDNGIGISPQQQKHLFLPFEQAEGGRSRKFEGIGLGLSLSKRIVDMLGGEIKVESELGKGSVFTFELKMEISKEAKVSVKEGVFAGKRVLVAEDLETNRMVIEAMLDETGVEIDFACNGLEAVDKYKSAPNVYDMILMDIRMPEMDGYEATNAIRISGLPGGSMIPIVAVSANSTPIDIAQSFEAGMNGHICKPIDISELLETMSKYLNPSVDGMK